jgi:predicted acyl esterase
MANALIKYGYVVAVGDPRGLGASYGTRRASWGWDEAWDTHDLIEWLGVQPWSDGNVGMWGNSYMGGIQVLAAAIKPPHLKAIFPGQTPFDQYDELYTIVEPRGPFGELGSMASDMASVPVDGDVDGDGDGYPDMLYEAVQQHQPHYDTIKAYAASLGQMSPPYSQVGISPYRDSIGPLVGTQFFYESSASSYIDEIGQSGVGVYNMGYWNNWLRRGSISAFVNFTNPSKLLMTATSNMPTFSFTTEHLRFFDYWLKGINNGIMDEPPIFYNVLSAPAGSDWRFAWKWPLPNQKNVEFYLAQGPSGSVNPGVNDGTLTLTTPLAMSGEDVYTVFYGITSANQDAKGLTYTTEPLMADIEVTGHPVVQLWISSDHDDGDFVANLEEVDGTTGKSTVISTGKLRSSLRKIADPPFSYMGLPWRRALQADEQKLVPGAPVKLLFDLLPVSKVFKHGNRIRLNIVCDSAPNTPVLSPAPVVSIYRNAVMNSYISLPVTTDPISVAVEVKPETLNLKSNGEFTVFITPSPELGKGYQAQDIDVSTLVCNGAPAVSGQVANDTLVAKFRRQDLSNTSAGPAVTLNVTGKFYYDIPFSGNDTVRVTKL